jgi:hypothetical protein
MEIHADYDAAKLLSLGLPLRADPVPPQACDTVIGLVTRTGDDDGVVSARWKSQSQAIYYEIQLSVDPITPTSWVLAGTSPRARFTASGLPSGQKRWLRVRAVNDLGAGSWSDPSCRTIP